MFKPAPRRIASSLLTGIAVSVALAGCGSGSDSGSGSSASAPASTDGATLLKAAFKTPASTAAVGTFDLKVSGTLGLPKDKDIKHLSGSAEIGATVDKAVAGKPLPPLSLNVAVDGDYTDGNGKSGKGKYSGGISYVNDQLYANWEGKDYAVGEELTKQALAEFDKELKKEGVNATSPLGGVDPNKVISAMALNPETWFKSTTVTDGGQIDGVDTQKVSGAVDVKAVADDITSGLKALPSAVPELPGVDELKTVTSASDADISKVEKAVKVLDASIWVGKDDHVERKIEVKVQVDSQEADSPGTANLTLDLTNSATPKAIVAPKNTAPITDLFLVIQKEFGGPGGPLEKAFA